MKDEITYKSAGHLPRPKDAPANRSTAPTPEVIGRINVAMTATIREVLGKFLQQPSTVPLSKKKLAEIDRDVSISLAKQFANLQ